MPVQRYLINIILFLVLDGSIPEPFPISGLRRIRHRVASLPCHREHTFYPSASASKPMITASFDALSRTRVSVTRALRVWVRYSSAVGRVCARGSWRAQRDPHAGSSCKIVVTRISLISPAAPSCSSRYTYTSKFVGKGIALAAHSSQSFLCVELSSPPQPGASMNFYIRIINR